MSLKKLLLGHTNVASNFETPASAIYKSVKEAAEHHPHYIARPETAQAFIAMEGLNDNVKNEIQTAASNFKATIESVLNSHGFGGKLTLAQEQAAIVAGIAGTNPAAHAGRAIANAGVLQAAAPANTVVLGNQNVQGAMEQRMSLEAYDNKENRNTVAFSVAYNMQAARQDDFGEAFFPTVVVTPDNVGFMVSIRMIYVQDEVRRELNGSLDKFNRKNVIKAVIDASILRNDQTRIVPVVRTGGANDSTANFVAATDVPPYTVQLDNQPVTTAPYAVGKRFSILGLSQTAALLSAGVMDQTDAVDSSVRLGAVYVKIAADATNPAAVVKFSVDKLPRSDFNYSVQGNTRELMLNFTTEALRVTKDTKKVDGSAVPQLAALTDSTVRLHANMFGTLLQDKGDTVVNTGGVSVARVTTVDGQELDLTSGAGATIANVFANATVIGYDLIAYRTNSNRRQRGQLVDTQFINQLYTVPLLPPITSLSPVGESDSGDSAMLSALITTTHIRTSNSAVTTLLEARDFLKDFVSASDLTGETPEILGVASKLVDPTYMEDLLDVEDQIDSLKSSDRAEDMAALIINKIRDMAYRLYTTSGYKAATDALFDGAAPKPMVVIGTDPILNRYLTLNGDMRLLGDYFDFKLVSTLDSRMAGKLVITFGMESSYNSGVANPMHFGNMAWKPELTVVMPITRNGSTSRELTVQPSYRHVVNLPVMGYLEVVNIDKIIAAKSTINTHVV